MARPKIRLDHAGIAEMLTSAEVALEVEDLAEQVASVLESDPAVVRHDADVVVDTYETDRAAASVTIAHAGGQGIQAKYGSLTRAAGAAGLEVKERAT